MKIIKLKKIMFLCICIAAGFSYYYYSEASLILPVSSTPVTEHTVVLDAGHGYPDGGAVSSSGISEADINLEIILKLQELLESSNCTVILTRSDENGIYDADATSKKSSDLKNRVEIVNNSGADVLVSVHLNKISQSKYSGWQSFFQKDSEKSEALAKSIQANLNYAIQKTNKREALSISNIYLIDNSTIPSVIVECGFLSNPEEAELLQNDEYQSELAWGIYTGIMDFFE